MLRWKNTRMILRLKLNEKSAYTPLMICLGTSTGKCPRLSMSDLHPPSIEKGDIKISTQENKTLEFS